MTYKFRIGLRAQWTLGGDDDAAPVPLQDMLALLAAIDATGNIAGACRACGLSYRHAWGVLRRFEGIFGTQLLITIGARERSWRRSRSACCGPTAASRRG